MIILIPWAGPKNQVKIAHVKWYETGTYHLTRLQICWLQVIRTHKQGCLPFLTIKMVLLQWLLQSCPKTVLWAFVLHERRFFLSKRSFLRNQTWVIYMMRLANSDWTNWGTTMEDKFMEKKRSGRLCWWPALLTALVSTVGQNCRAVKAVAWGSLFLLFLCEYFISWQIR